MRTSRSAFTLVELLVVIAVIVILMGMLFPAISIVKGHAKKAKVRALISQVAGGLEAFRNVNSIYPESTSKKTPVNTSDPFLDAFATGSGSSMTVIPASAVTLANWDKVNTELVEHLESVTREPFPSQSMVGTNLVDGWGKPLRYRPARFYPFIGTSPLIDSDKPPRPDGYQLWSVGPNGNDEFGAGDDLTEWAR